MPNVMSISGGGTPGPHKISHQDTGTDEISVAGLSGVLANNQLTEWALIEDPPATYAPSAHKISHQDGGSDELNVTGLIGAGSIVDRGDPAAIDYTKASFTIDSAWHDLNLSGIVPAGAKGVILGLGMRNNTYGIYIRFRKKGNSNAINIGIAFTQAGGVDIAATLLVPCDTNRVIEYYVLNSGTWDSINLWVNGWWT